MEDKKNILEICNWLWIWWTEKTLQIFCKYLDKNRYNVFACWIFKWWKREELIKDHVLDLLVANWDINKIKEFTLKNNINIVHWHSITQSPWVEFEKSLELLKFFKENNIKIIETSPFSLYNDQIDNLLDIKLFVSKTNLIKYFWKFWKVLKDKSKYSYLYNPLDVADLEKYRLNNDEKTKLREKYWIWKNDFVIWKVWRASLWKWDDTIIDIVPTLINIIPNLKVLIRAIPEIKKEKIQKLGVEKYFIYLSESVIENYITDTYQLMDVMLHTSRIWECNSVSINEWLFFWLPIITKSTDFLQKTLFWRDNWQTEIIKDNINGIVSNKNNEIITFITKLYKDNIFKKEIVINNLNKSFDLFDWKNITIMLETIFENGISNRFDYDNEFYNYKNSVKRNTLYDLFKININAVYDKFINNA